MGEWQGRGANLVIDGRRIFTTSQGTGDPTVLFVHGFETPDPDIQRMFYGNHDDAAA